MPVLKEVTEHRQEIKSARDTLKLPASKYPIEFLEAIMHIESNGNEMPDEKDRYRYWFQIGQAYLEDARAQARRIGFDAAAHGIPDDFRQLYDAGVPANAMVVMLAMEKYAFMHKYDPYLMAFLHKAGAGSLKQAWLKIKAGYSIKDAIYWVATEFRRSSNGKLWVPRSYLYVYGYDTDGSGPEHRFAQAFADYSKDADEQLADFDIDECTKAEPWMTLPSIFDGFQWE